MNQYQIIEDKLENLHLFVWTPEGKIICALNISNESKDTIFETIRVVAERTDLVDGAWLFGFDEEKSKQTRIDYFSEVSQAPGSKLIADNNGLYKENMNFRARRIFGISSGV